jgi:PPOX class probable F420-dependent enzyme
MVFDSGSPQDEHALARLGRDKVAWLTSVTPDGQPQTFPVWFLWEAGEVLVYSSKKARRNANIAANPRVSIHLEGDEDGADLVIVEGAARIDDAAPPPDRHAAYMAKYREWMVRDLGSVEAFLAEYIVPVRIAPTRGRATGA